MWPQEGRGRRQTSYSDRPRGSPTARGSPAQPWHPEQLVSGLLLNPCAHSHGFLPLSAEEMQRKTLQVQNACSAQCSQPQGAQGHLKTLMRVEARCFKVHLTCRE